MQYSERDLIVFYYKLALREIERATRGQVRIVIVHSYGAATPGASRTRRRAPGAEIVSAWLIFRGEQYQLDLGTPHLILFDFLCWHCANGIGKSASEIEAALNRELFYVRYASSTEHQRPVLARASRTNIRKVVQRIRDVMADLFDEEDLPLNPKAILRSEPTSTREVRYSVWADVSWES